MVGGREGTRGGGKKKKIAHNVPSYVRLMSGTIFLFEKRRDFSRFYIQLNAIPFTVRLKLQSNIF